MPCHSPIERFSELRRRLERRRGLRSLAALLSVSSVASAQPPPEPAPEKAPKPPPYSLPFQLRPVAPGSVVRSDTALGFYESPQTGDKGSAVASMLLASYKIGDSFAPLVRVGLVSNSPPGTTLDSATAFLNPVVGAIYGLKLTPELKLGLFLGVTVPVGSGGGNDPDLNVRAALAAGILTRSAMDNAMFAVNYFTVFPGVDLAFVGSGFTAQVEATLFQLTRVRGEDVDKESSRTNFTTGLHLGYFLLPELSLGGELRHQRWLSTPRAVEQKDNLRDTTTFAVGPRVHLKLGEKVWLRPGIAYARGLDKPMTAAKYNIVQIDIPFAF
jgi:hypothetical protein